MARRASGLCDDSGFSLIEVMLALVVLVVMLAASTSLISNAMTLSRNSRLRQLATDIASSQLDCAVASINLVASDFPTPCGEPQALLSALGFSGVGGVAAMGAVTRGGVSFTIEQEVAPGNGACALPSGGAPPELEVTDYVTWANGVSPSMHWWQGGVAGRLVEESTLVAVPAAALNPGDGSILVKVTDDDAPPGGQPLVDVSVQPGGESAMTTDQGCALFANMPPGSYTVTASRPGWVDSNNDYASGSPSALVMTGTVQAGSTLTLPAVAPMYYAQAADVTAEYSATSPYSVPANASSLPLSFYNAGLGPNAATGLSTDPYVAPAPGASGDEVFPFPGTSYEVVAGSCVVPGTSGGPGTPSTPDASASEDGSAVSVVPGGSGTATFDLSSVAVVVTDSTGQLDGAAVTAQASTATGSQDAHCPTSGPSAMPVLQLGSTGSAGLTGLVRLLGGPHAAVLAGWWHVAGVGPRSLAARARSLEGSASHPAAYVLTAASLSSSANPSVYGQPVTFSATGLQASYVSVKFADGGTALGCETVSAGTAQGSFSTLTTGSHSITATAYAGSGCTGGSASAGALTQTVDTNSSTALTSSANPAAKGSSVTFTATVAPVAPASGTPTGTVKFEDNGSAISGCASVALVSGAASCATSALGASTPSAGNAITATYSGDTTFQPSVGKLSEGVVQYAALVALPYGYFLLAATNGAEASTNTTTAVVLEVAQAGISACAYTGGTYDAQGYYSGGSCSQGWQPVPPGTPVFVSVK